jgi:TRAP-type C4-dicarboxylate transport system permease small subunit
MNSVVRIVARLNRILMCGACFVLLATMVMAVVNMIGRPMKMPVQGSFELMGLGGSLIVALTLGYSQESRTHISVDILFNTFPARVKAVCIATGDLLCSAFFGIAAWQMTRFGYKLYTSGEYSETLGMPVYPVVFAVAAGLAGLALTLLVTVLAAKRGLSWNR